jgi:hypothetical protein
MIRRRGRNVIAVPRTSAAISSGAKPPQTVASVSMGAGGEGARAKVGAEAELCVGRGIGVGIGKGFCVLAAGGTALVQHDHRCPGLRGGDGGGQSGGAGADDQHIARLLCGLWRDRFVAERRQRGRGVASDDHAVRHFGHAGALPDAAVHGHDAVEAGPHAAMQAARCAG